MKRKNTRAEKIEKDEQNGVDEKNDSSEDEGSVESNAEQAGKKKKADKRKSGGKKPAKAETGSENDDSEPEEPKKKKGSKRKVLTKKSTKMEEEEQNNVSDDDSSVGETKKKKVDKRKSAGKKSKKDDDSDEGGDSASDLEETQKKKGGKRKSAGKKSKKDSESHLDEGGSESDSPKDGNKDSEDEEDDVDYEVEEVVGEKTVKGAHQFLIRWKGYSADNDTWESESTVDCPELIKKFRESKGGEQNNVVTKKSKKNPAKKPKKETAKEAEVDWSSSDEFEVDRILEVHFKRNGKREFLVSWKGYSSSQDSWEPEENLDCHDLITKFMDKVDAAKKVDSKELRVKPAKTDRFTLQMGGSNRRLSRRLDKKQRVQYHDSE